MRNLTYLLIGVIVIVAALIVFFIVGWAAEIPLSAADDAVFTASISDKSGVDISSSFTIAFCENVSSASISKYLQVEPEIELGIHQGKSSAEVLLVPVEPLSPGTLYKFSLITEEKTLYWSFQTADSVKIVDFSPAAHSVGVSVDGQIVFTLNQMLSIDTEKLDKYITIEPEISGSYRQSGRLLYFIPDNSFAEYSVYRVSITGMPQINSNQQLAEEYSFSFETGGKDGAVAVSSWEISAQEAFTIGETPSFSIIVNDQAMLGNDEEMLDNDNATDEDKTRYSVYTELWRFSGAEQYAKLLLANDEQKPLWSFSGQHLKDVDTNHLTNVASGSIDLQGSFDREFILSLSGQQEGYYLLSTYFLGERRDVLFQISNISAYCATGGSRILFWLHDAITGESLSGAKVSAYLNEGIYTSDKNGAIVLARSPQSTVYIIKHGEYSLVQIDNNYNEDSFSQSTYLWRYLYLDKDIYSKGDTINFWGMVKPRDNSSLEYSRVSVFLYQVDESEPISKTYADVDNNFFSGQYVLPYLSEGLYRLVISQSGKELVAKDFSIGNSDNDEETIPINNSIGPSLSMETSLLEINSAYKMRFDMHNADEYLFIRDESSIVGYAVEDSPYHPGVFDPKNSLNYYLWGVAYADKKYFTTSPVNIILECQDRIFDISVDGDFPEKTGENREITINSVAGAKVMVSILKSSSSVDSNIFNEIYGDFSATTLNYSASSHAGKDVLFVNHSKLSNQRVQDENVFFSVFTADSKGKVSCPISIDEPGNYCILIESIENSSQISVGSYSDSFSVKDGLINKQNVDTVRCDDYLTGTISDGLVLKGLNNNLLLVSDENHIQIIADLLDASAQSYADADEYFAVAASRQILGRLIGNDYFGYSYLLDNGQIFQTDSGGIALITDGEADLQYSIIVAALQSENVDRHRLKKFFYGYLCHDASRSQQIIALVGLAALDCPVMTELLLLADNSDLTISERLFVIWGIQLCGGIQNAHDIYCDYFVDDSAGICLVDGEYDDYCVIPENSMYLYAIINSYWLDHQQIDQLLSSIPLSTKELYGTSLNVLINNILLNNAYYDKSKFSYSIDGKTVNVDLVNNQFSLYLANDITSNLTFHAEEDSICYLIIKCSEDTMDIVENMPKFTN